MINLWWCLFPPTNVRVFYRCGSFDNRDKFGLALAAAAFKRCSEREQRFIVWRDPVFGVFRRGGQQ